MTTTFVGNTAVHRAASSMKKQIRNLLEHRTFDELADLAGRKRRVLGLLVSLTFDSDPLIGWRAVEAMGVAADRIAEEDPDSVREHLRRLYWLLSEESGGICWRAPEAMAEIVGRRAGMFGDYIPIVVSLIDQMAEEDLVHFRPGILWAIGRLGHLAEKEIDAALSSITVCLDLPDGQVRGMAAWCLWQCGRGDILAKRSDLLSDRGPVEIYEDGELVGRTVGQLVREYWGAPIGTPLLARQRQKGGITDCFASSATGVSISDVPFFFPGLKRGDSNSGIS